MSSAAEHSPKLPKRPADPLAEAASLKTPPARPTLVPPPRRPVKPAVEKLPEPDLPTEPVEAKIQAEPTPPEENQSDRYRPIAPPSEPMQYRAIGLIRGIYAPEDEQFNRGTLTTEEGTAVEAVLLGRVTSLVKKHLDLAESHLWVVYPRTGRAEDDAADQNLYVQIVGVWEPETLGLPGETVESEETEAGDSALAGEPVEPSPTEGPVGPKVSLEDLPPVNENYFSIRGEIVHYDENEQVIIVKILQGLKRPPASRKAFRLMVQGTLQGRTMGYFWDLNVKRDAKMLVLDQGTPIGIVPPRKRKGGPGAGGPRRGGPPRRGPGGPGGPGGKRPFSPRGMDRDRQPPGSDRISEMPKRRES